MECLGAPNVYIHSSTWRKSSSCCLAKTTAFLNYVLFRYICEILVRHTHYLATLYTCRLRQSLAKVVVKIKCLEWSFQTSHCRRWFAPSTIIQISVKSRNLEEWLPTPKLFFVIKALFFPSRCLFFVSLVSLSRPGARPGWETFSAKC